MNKINIVVTWRFCFSWWSIVKGFGVQWLVCLRRSIVSCICLNANHISCIKLKHEIQNRTDYLDNFRREIAALDLLCSHNIKKNGAPTEKWDRIFAIRRFIILNCNSHLYCRKRSINLLNENLLFYWKHTHTHQYQIHALPIGHWWRVRFHCYAFYQPIYSLFIGLVHRKFYQLLVFFYWFLPFYSM